MLRRDRRLGLGNAAITPIGALAGLNLASRRKFCAVAARRNSSLAPHGPRSRKRGVLTVNSIPLAHCGESGDAPSHGGHAQTELVDSHRALPITSFARSRDRYAAPPLNVLRRKSPKRLVFSNFDRGR
jgi:hypothetical protein